LVTFSASCSLHPALPALPAQLCFLISARIKGITSSAWYLVCHHWRLVIYFYKRIKMPGSGFQVAGWWLHLHLTVARCPGLYFLLALWLLANKKKRCLAFATRSLGLAFPFFQFSFYTPTRTFICVTRYPLELPKFHARNVLHHIHISFCLSFSFPIFPFFFFGNTQSRKIWGWQLMPAPTTNSHNHKLAYVCAHEYICRSHV